MNGFKSWLKPFIFVLGINRVVRRAQGVRDVESLGLTPYRPAMELDAGHWSILAEQDEVGT